jgi:hypothetical protein
MKGKIRRIVDRGTTVMVYVQDSNCRSRAVTFDHRTFKNWYETAVDYTGREKLTGMWVSVEGDEFDGATISLPERRKMDLGGGAVLSVRREDRRRNRPRDSCANALEGRQGKTVRRNLRP